MLILSEPVCPRAFAGKLDKLHHGLCSLGKHAYVHWKGTGPVTLNKAEAASSHII